MTQIEQIITGILSLNGEWQYIKDADERLTFDEVKNICGSSQLPRMDIPINWQIAGLHNFNGAVWFIKNFLFTSESLDDIKVINFYGVDYFTDVWLNNIYLGRHEGYFQSFYFNITEFVKPGDNQLIVKVTSPLEESGTVWPYKKKLIKGIFNHHDCRPGAWDNEHGQDQNTGGIWNKVELEFGKKIFLDNVKITSKLNDSFSTAIVLVELEYESVSKSETKQNVNALLIFPSGEKEEKKFDLSFKPGKGKLSFTFSISNPQLWWSWDLGDQNLYSLKLSSDEINQREFLFSFKDVKLDNSSQFFLNGKRLFLRGTNIIPTQYLSELDENKIYQQVSLMKEANINIVRVHAHVNRKEFYDECDRQGILVWQDFALQWTYDDSSEFITNAVGQIKDMVRQHCNHPAIAFWCCHNEPGEQINTLDNFLYDAVLSEDNSRIIRKASNYEEHPYDGWYWGQTEHYEATPMGPLVTEFGAQALPNKESLERFIPADSLFPPELKIWKYHDFQPIQTFMIAKIDKGNSIEDFVDNSQTYQSNLLTTAIDSYRRKKNDSITGIFQFMFVDCWPSITWSVVDYYGIKKKGYDALKLSFQPVYLSVKLRQNCYLPGDKLNLDLWLINDLHRDFSHCKIVVKIHDEIIAEMENLNAPSDTIQKFHWESLNIKLPQNIYSGRHHLTFEVQDGTEIVSLNFADIEIVGEEFLSTTKTISEMSAG